MVKLRLFCTGDEVETSLQALDLLIHNLEEAKAFPLVSIPIKQSLV
jgi:hypothetical protein